MKKENRKYCKLNENGGVIYSDDKSTRYDVIKYSYEYGNTLFHALPYFIRWNTNIDTWHFLDKNVIEAHSLGEIKALIASKDNFHRCINEWNALSLL